MFENPETLQKPTEQVHSTAEFFDARNAEIKKQLEAGDEKTRLENATTKIEARIAETQQRLQGTTIKIHTIEKRLGMQHASPESIPAIQRAEDRLKTLEAQKNRTQHEFQDLQEARTPIPK